jgi:beta-lactamase superfamily II metal-dependent hydrolase
LAGELSDVGPSEGEIEVSVFGPGYGECVVVHLGQKEWIIIDSCIAQGRREPAALEYLQRLGVDVRSDVKLVLATHWHDDHIRGLAKLVRACDSARVAISSALHVDELLVLIEAVRPRAMMASSGINELGAVIDLLEERRVSPIWAVPNRLLHRSNGNRSVEITSLSPSDDAITASKRGFAALIPEPGQGKRRVSARRPNHAAVVVHITSGAQTVLLGSDLEEGPGTSAGWTKIITSSERPGSKAIVYKIAHHGSSSGDHPGIWSELVVEDPLAVMTPFMHGRQNLPTDSDLRRLRKRAGVLLMTSNRQPRTRKRRDRAVERALEGVLRSLRDAQPPMGHVRLRARTDTVAPGPWSIETSEFAAVLSARREP